MNIPNILTMLRFLLIPIFVYYFFSETQYGIQVSTFVFILAGITDVLDGYIARKYKLVTRLGIVLDPLADKLMLLTVLISITIKFKISIWALVVVSIKEIIMILGAIGLYNVHNIIVPANIFGKLSTLMSYIAILAVTFNLPYGWILMNIFILLTVLTLAVYVGIFTVIKIIHKYDTIKK